MPKIVIIGGGPAGIACALTLVAARGKPAVPQDMQIGIFDTGASDLLSAALHEVPGISAGMHGSELLSSMRKQVVNTGVIWHEEKIVRISSRTSPFILHGQSGQNWDADIIVLASGFKHFEILLEFDAVTRIHPHSLKPRVCLPVDAEKRVAPGIYVAGLLSGVPSMFSIAIGSGTEVACHILSDLTGQPTVVHDVPKAAG